MKYIIYKHTILETKKSYIGFTSLTMEERLHKHFTNVEYGINTKFYNAVRKYGRNSIVSQIIDYAETQDEAYDKESFYIEKYDTYKNGYNSTIRGGGGWIIGQLSKEKQESYFIKRSLLNTGDKNPNHSGYSDDDIVQVGAELFKNNDYIFNIRLWYKLADEKGYPKSFSKCRFNGEGMNGFKKRICEYLGIEKLEKYKPTKEHKEKLSIQQKDMCWITNGLEAKRIYKSDIDKYDPSWILGHRFTKNKK
jgi:hypothetical protein